MQNYQSLLDLTKPFLFDDSVDDGICWTFIPEEYAELLKSNPNLNIYCCSIY